MRAKLIKPRPFGVSVRTRIAVYRLGSETPEPPPQESLAFSTVWLLRRYLGASGRLWSTVDRRHMPVEPVLLSRECQPGRFHSFASVLGGLFLNRRRQLGTVGGVLAKDGGFTVLQVLERCIISDRPDHRRRPKPDGVAFALASQL
jgi:hypothetical protein